MFPISELERTLFGLGARDVWRGRRLAHFFPEVVDGPGVPNAQAAAARVRLNVWDSGPNVVIVAEVPGLSQKDIQLSFERDTLTVSGERRDDLPEGYTAHRRERANGRFSRSIRFGVPVDVDNIAAVVKNGLLTITLPKQTQATARTITVQAGNN